MKVINFSAMQKDKNGKAVKDDDGNIRFDRVGLTLFITDDGKYRLKDSRSNETFFGSSGQKKQQQPQKNQQQSNRPYDDFDDDIGF